MCVQTLDLRCTYPSQMSLMFSSNAEGSLGISRPLVLETLSSPPPSMPSLSLGKPWISSLLSSLSLIPSPTVLGDWFHCSCTVVRQQSAHLGRYASGWRPGLASGPSEATATSSILHTGYKKNVFSSRPNSQNIEADLQWWSCDTESSHVMCTHIRKRKTWRNIPKPDLFRHHKRNILASTSIYIYWSTYTYQQFMRVCVICKSDLLGFKTELGMSRDSFTAIPL